MPIQKAVPVTDLTRKTILLYGLPKLGKSTFASLFPSAIFIATEAGLNDLACTRWEYGDGTYVVKSWDDLLRATTEVVQTDAKTIVIDTVDNAYHLCDRAVCTKAGVEYKLDGTLGYGRGSAMINNEFRRYLVKLTSMNLGIILISHAQHVEREGRTGTITVSVPTLPDKIHPVVAGIMDMILFLQPRDEVTNNIRVTRRVLCTNPSPFYEAGDRTSRLPAEIILPENAKDGYAAFLAAYQQDVTANTDKKGA